MAEDPGGFSIEEEFLELALSGSIPDAEAFLAAHPDADEAARRRVLALAGAFGRRDAEDDADDDAATQAIDAALAGRGEVDATRLLSDRPDLGARERARLQTIVDALTLPSSGVGDEPPMPHRLGRYEVVRLLGQGGEGVVWLAHDPRLERQVVLKTVRNDHGRSREQEIERLERSARLASRLAHTGLCQVLDWVDCEHGLFVVMPFIEGRTLAQELRQETKVDPKQVATLCAQLARAAHHAHECGIVHRDLKPANIALRSDGSPVILDFGFALEPTNENSRKGGSAEGRYGTAPYMAPEQIDGRVDLIDRRTDVYGLGVILYEMLTRKRPFLATGKQLARQIREGDVVAPRRWNAAIPADLEATCLKAMAARREERYETALALAEDLERFLAGSPTLARPMSVARRVKWILRRRPLAAAAFVLVALLTTETAILLGRWQRAKRRKEAVVSAISLLSDNNGGHLEERDLARIMELLGNDATSKKELQRVIDGALTPKKMLEWVKDCMQRAPSSGIELLWPTRSVCDLQPRFKFSIDDPAIRNCHFAITVSDSKGPVRTLKVFAPDPANGTIIHDTVIEFSFPDPFDPETEYWWKLRLDKDFHRELADSLRPPIVSFRTVSPQLRETLTARHLTGNDAADHLLNAISLLSHGFAEDAAKHLDAIPATDRSMAWWALYVDVTLQTNDDPTAAESAANAALKIRSGTDAAPAETIMESTPRTSGR